MPQEDKEIERIEVKADKEMQAKLKIIKSLGLKYNHEAIRMAVFHLADHVERGDFKK